VTYEIVNLLNHSRAAPDVTSGHVPENGGTWHAFTFLHCDRKAEIDSFQLWQEGSNVNLREVLLFTLHLCDKAARSCCNSTTSKNHARISKWFDEIDHRAGTMTSIWNLSLKWWTPCLFDWKLLYDSESRILFRTNILFTNCTLRQTKIRRATTHSTQPTNNLF
jgi:hypothetical protein